MKNRGNKQEPTSILGSYLTSSFSLYICTCLFISKLKKRKLLKQWFLNTFNTSFSLKRLSVTSTRPKILVDSPQFSQQNPVFATPVVFQC